MKTETRSPRTIASACGQRSEPFHGAGKRSPRDLLLGAGCAVVLHGAVFVGGEFWRSGRVASAVPEIVLETAGATEAVAAVEFPVADAAAKCGEAPDGAFVPAGKMGPESWSTLVVPELLSRRGGTVVLTCSRIEPGAGGPGGAFGRAMAEFGRTGVAGRAAPVFELADLDQPPSILAQPLPRYPPELARSGAAGEVLMSFVVDADGAVCSPRVVECSRPEFCAPALQAVLCWKFRPGRKDGRRVATRVEVPIAFALPRIRKPTSGDAGNCL